MNECNWIYDFKQPISSNCNYENLEKHNLLQQGITRKKETFLCKSFIRIIFTNH